MGKDEFLETSSEWSLCGRQRKMTETLDQCVEQ